MDIDKIRAFAKERIELHETGREECETYIEDYWNRLSDYIASDVPAAILLMTRASECTGEIFSDWSEVFDDVVRKSHSREFVEALPIAAERFAEASAHYNLKSAIEAAQAEL